MSAVHDPQVERTLVTVQAASGALFAVFLLAHLVNAMVAMAGPAAYDALRGQLRAVYQVPPVEVLLVGAPLVAHVGASVWRMVRRRRRGQRTPPGTRSRLQRWSAVVLLVFLVGHVVATRGASLIFGVWPGFDAIAFTMIWTPAYFIPYYSVFSIAALYHAINGLALALPRLGLRGPSQRRMGPLVAGLTVAGALALLLGVAGFAGAFTAVRDLALDGDYAHLIERLGLVDRSLLR